MLKQILLSSGTAEALSGELGDRKQTKMDSQGPVKMNTQQKFMTDAAVFICHF